MPKYICVHCKVEVTNFRDMLSLKEFSQSKLCQDCQDKLFPSYDPLGRIKFVKKFIDEYKDTFDMGMIVIYTNAERHPEIAANVQIDPDKIVDILHLLTIAMIEQTSKNEDSD